MGGSRERALGTPTRKVLSQPKRRTPQCHRISNIQKRQRALVASDPNAVAAAVVAKEAAAGQPFDGRVAPRANMVIVKRKVRVRTAADDVFHPGGKIKPLTLLRSVEDEERSAGR